MIFIDAIGIGLVFPVLPDLFMNKKYGLIVSNTNLSREILYSFSLALIPLSSMFGAPILGTIADVYSKNKIILYGLGALTFNYLLSIIAIVLHEVWLFLLTMLLSGFFSGTYSVGSALISNLSSNSEERISNFKLQTFASFLGLILGPGLSISITKISIVNPLTIPFVIAFILGVTNWLVLYYNFRYYQNIDTKTIVYNRFCLITLKQIFSSLWYIFNNQYIRSLAFSYLLFQFGLGLFLQSLSLYLAITYSYSPAQIGRFFVVMAITLIISMHFLQKLATYFFEYKIQMKFSLKLLSILLILESIFGSTIIDKMNLSPLHFTWGLKILFYIFIPMINLGFINLFAISVSRTEQGRVMGGSAQLYSISWFISSLTIGGLIMHYNLILLLSGISFILSYIVLSTFLQKKKY